jgi:uncharacterized membrane protein SpoIIM required for sporulation
MTDLMKSYRFREERESDWRRLELILMKAETNGVRKLSQDEMLALPRLYRQAVSSLSVARTISLDQNVVEYLETLCTRGYLFVYGARLSFGERIAQFFRRDWPNAVKLARWATLLACFCLFGGAALGFFLVMQDEQWFWSFHSGGMFDDGRNPSATQDYLRSTLYTDPSETGDGALAGFSGQLFNHNAQIALLAFALGFAFGLPTAILLFYNGVMLGSFYAVFWSKGLGYEFTGWLLIHGVTELFAIILAGAAGFVIGGAVAFPGRLTRMASARNRGRSAALIALGCVIMLCIAALLEGFGRQLINSDGARYTIAAATLLIWCVYFYGPRRQSAV